MPFVRSDGTDIYWKLEGEPGPPPLVLLNSIGTDMDLWDSTLPALRRYFRVLRIDMRGHGASDAPSGDYTLQQLAGDIRAVMVAAEIPTAAIAGVSLGGMVAMQLALDASQAVTQLVLVCTSATMDRSAWTARVAKVRSEGMAGIAELAMARFLSPGFASQQPAIAATIRQALLDMDPAGYAGCAAAIRDMEIAGRLGEIRCPTLVITGKRDISTPFSGHGDHLVNAIAGAGHISLEAAHLAPLEAPAALSDAIRAFVRA